MEHRLQDQDVRCLAVDPLNPALVYAGTQGNGILRSPDRGRSWMRCGLEGRIVKAVAASPIEPGVLYAGLKPSRPLRLTRRRGPLDGVGDLPSDPLPGLLVLPRRDAGATLFITADVKYHEAQDAVDQGLDLVVLDHFATERPVLDLVAERLRRLVSGIPVSVATAPTSPFKAGGS